MRALLAQLSFQYCRESARNIAAVPSTLSALSLFMSIGNRSALLQEWKRPNNAVTITIRRDYTKTLGPRWNFLLDTVLAKGYGIALFICHSPTESF